MSTLTQNKTASFGWGALIGSLGGLIGLGGAEFRLPTLEAVILNKAMSLVVAFALLFRGGACHAFAALKRERSMLVWMAAGSIIGAGIGGLMLGVMPSSWLLTGLGIILLVSAIKVFQHTQEGSKA